MFRPILTAAAALALLTLAACAETPKTAATAAPAAGSSAERVEIPAAKNEASPLIGDSAGATCRADCDRRHRICGEGDRAASGSDRVQSLTAPRLFSRADDCRYQLDQCLRSCVRKP